LGGHPGVEPISQLVVSHDLGFVSTDDYNQVREQIETISYKLNSLRKAALHRQP